MLSRARAHMPNGTPMAWMASEYDQPVYVSHGQGAGFTDVDGFTYLDFNASDMSMFCGHANPAIVAAVQAQVARSTQFLLPTEASVEVAEELSRRYQLPHWQFTLSATQANTEAIRLARAVTGREVVVLFEGHYHGHLEEGLVDLADGQARAVQRGLSRGTAGRVRIAQFNGPGTLQAALEPGDVALVLTEPAMTNGIHMLLPEPGWHEALRELTRQHGALLAIDERMRLRSGAGHGPVPLPGAGSDFWPAHSWARRMPSSVCTRIYLNPNGGSHNGGSRVEHTRCLATERDGMLDASTPVSDASSLPITSGVTTLTRLLGPRWPVAVGHTLMAFSWAGESRTRITGRPWREGTPRHRGGPGGKEASRHASSGPEMARLGAGCAAPPSRPGSPWRQARACEFPYTPRRRDRRRL